MNETLKVTIVIPKHLWLNLAIAAAAVQKSRAVFIREKLMAACVGKGVPEQAVPLAYNFSPGAARPPAPVHAMFGETRARVPGQPWHFTNGDVDWDHPYWIEVKAESQRKQAEFVREEEARLAAEAAEEADAEEIDAAEQVRAENDAAARADAIRRKRESDDAAFEIERIEFDADEMYAKLLSEGETAEIAYAIVKAKASLYNVQEEWEPLADIDGVAP